jgi:hypothetical protein
MGTIYQELRQTKPFPTLGEEAFVTLLRTSDFIRTSAETVLAPWNLSVEQYNVLRILAGSTDGCHPTLEIASRRSPAPPTSPACWTNWSKKNSSAGRISPAIGASCSSA